MPSSAEVLARATAAANDYTPVAIAWHVVILMVSLALVTRRLRPSARAAAIALTTPLVSVSVVAFLSGNPFNGAVFAAATIGLGLLATRARGRMLPPPSIAAAVGIAAIVVGLTYPHFLAAQTVFDFFYAAPTGLLPCPTLLMMIGFALLGPASGARAWGIALAALGVVYGLVGVVWLGVTLDVTLLVAALSLLIEVLAPSRLARRAQGTPVSAMRSANTTSNSSAAASSASPHTSSGSWT